MINPLVEGTRYTMRHNEVPLLPPRDKGVTRHRKSSMSVTATDS